MWSCSQGPSGIGGFPKFTLLRKKQRGHLEGLQSLTAAWLSLPTAIPKGWMEQERFSLAGLFLPPQHGRTGTAISCLPAATGKQGLPASKGGTEPCSTAHVPCLQSDPLEGSKKGLAGGNNSCFQPRVFLSRHHELSLPRDEHPVGQIRPKPGFHTFVCLLFQSTVYT